MLPRDIHTYLKELVQEHSSINSIWLIGSRANGCSRKDSDWDFLVFADEDVLQSMCRDPSLNRKDIDLLIVYDGSSFTEPWGNDPKQGDLREWKWSEVSQTGATYIQTKFVVNEADTERLGTKHGMEFGHGIAKQVRGVIVWRKSVGFLPH